MDQKKENKVAFWKLMGQSSQRPRATWEKAQRCLFENVKCGQWRLAFLDNQGWESTS